MKTDEDDAEQAETSTGACEMSEAEIDENLEGSFPASDPPAWTLGSNHHAEAKPESEHDASEED